MSDCIFCKIVDGEIPSDKVYEDELCMAFNDVNPVAPTHILIIPKKHKKSLNEMDNEKLLGKLMLAAKKIAKEQGLSQDGYRIVNNTGKLGGQTVNHFHLHLLGGRNLQWPPG